MATFNLIPNSYALEVQFKRDLTKFIIGYSLLIAIGLSAILLIKMDITKQSTALKIITEQQYSNQILSAKVDSLIDEEHILITQYNTLNAVNFGLTSNQLLQSIDLALNKDIQFNVFKFIRDADESKSNTLAKTKLIASAKNHASLADFMDRLNKQVLITSVELTRSQKSQSKENTIEFELTIDISISDEKS